MSAPGYGRYQVAEAPSALRSLHLHDGGKLREVDHESPIEVLDQSDLLAQRIHATHFIPGCKEDPDALGSCTAQATMAELGSLLDPAGFLTFCRMILDSSKGAEPAKALDDPVGIQRSAISFYYRCTHQTGDPSQEWPPTDCGSSGPYVVTEAEHLGVIHGAKIASGAENLCSLLQGGGVLVGSPFLYAWEEPDAHGFIDGDGSPATLGAQIKLGVAGGHETRISAIEKLALLPTGHIDIRNTILRVRNSWSKSWGDHGCYRVHLSTFVALGGACDFRQLVR